MADDIMRKYWDTPPVARTIATAAFVCSVCVHFGFLSGYYFLYDPYFLKMMPPQVWRFVTCFLITGPGLSILFDTYFLYSFLSQLEKSHPRLAVQPDLIWYLVFITGTIQVLSHLSGFVYPQLLSALIVALCYTATQEQRGARTNYMFFDIPTQTMPFAMMAVSLFMGGLGLVIHQLHGLVAAHLFLFLSKIWPDICGGRNIVSAPAFVSGLVDKLGGAAARRPPAQAQSQSQSQSQSSGRNTGVLPDSWRTRGPGHRLG
ncbi:Derlin-2 [Escovopsis weberi]|uniref:Derlin n=1 Tax=Escovopsis weberi TaxID=150374 RepID=A0A0M8MTZ3_ESCWE|nr:Derlin-2 [Escovopsis weberi]